MTETETKTTNWFLLCAIVASLSLASLAWTECSARRTAERQTKKAMEVYDKQAEMLDRESQEIKRKYYEQLNR